MADTPKVYVMCDANCKWEGMTKEQILTAITQAVNDGEITDLDTGFITTVKTINGTPLKFFVGEQHEYEALTEDQKENLFALITNDTNKESIFNTLADHGETLAQHTDFINKFNENVIPLIGYAGTAVAEWKEGTSAVPKAEKDADGNNIAATYSKKAEARQEISTGLPSKTIYSSSTTSQPRVDLSSVMLSGKTANDTIGISGKFTVTIAGNAVSVKLSVLWDDVGYRLGEVNTCVVANSKVYLLKFNIGIDTSNRLYCSAGLMVSGSASYGYNITDNAAASVSKIDVETLNIYYK